MGTVGIDISMRSTGAVYTHDDDIKFTLIQSKAKNLNDEALLIHNADKICEFIQEVSPTQVNIEGLSFNSVSGSKDLVDGNFWYIRTTIYKQFPNIPTNIISVKEWRSKILSKEEQQTIRLASKQIKAAKDLVEYSKYTHKEKKQFRIDYKQMLLLSDIKYQTYLKLPIYIQEEFNNFTDEDDCRYDLADGFFLSLFRK